MGFIIRSKPFRRWSMATGGRKRKAVVCVGLTLTCLLLLFVNFLLPYTNSMCLLFPYWIPHEFPRVKLHDNTNVTIVTAFFDLGTFQKGAHPEHQHRPDTYLQWASPFLFLQNPLVVFTDSKGVADLFHNNTSSKKVKIVHIPDRTSLFAFKNLTLIKQIFSDPNYPKFHPNTVVPEYSCTQHAKMDVVEKVIALDMFHTKYFAWVDLGYFRHLTFRKRKFWITVPPEFDDRKVAACQIQPPDFTMDTEDIFKKNVFWVGGGMLLATRHKYLTFIGEYRRAMQFFMAGGLVNTDQQVLYSMFKPSVKTALNVSTELQVFSWPWNYLMGACWFHLGYHCYREQ